MADGKETKLSIVLRAVDKATAPIRRALSKFTAAATAPARALSGLYQRTGLAKVTEGIKGIGGLLGPVGGVISRLGSMLGSVIEKIPVLGAALTGVVVGATAGLIHLVDKFDELGKKAAEIGVSADFLAAMRSAAERTGVDVGTLNTGLTMFSVNVGKAKAGTGRLATFLERVSPALLRQLKAAKSNEEAFDLLAGAMGKLTDPAKRSALAQMAFGNAMVSPLFAQGRDKLKALRDAYLAMAGSQQDATEQAAVAHDAIVDMHAAVDGLEAGIVTGLAPALAVIVKQLSAWFVAHRADVAAWAKKFGEELPGAVSKTVDAFKGMIAWTENATESLKGAYDEASKLLDKLGGIQKILSKVGAVVSFSREYGPTGLIGKVESNAVNGGMSDADRRAAQAFVENHPDSWLARHMRSGKTAQDVFGRDLDAADVSGQAGNVFTPDLAPGPLNTRPDVSAQASAALAPAMPSFAPSDMAGFLAQVHAAVAATAAPPSQAKVSIDISGAPRGTRVKADPKNTADVDLSVGYNMLPGMP